MIKQKKEKLLIENLLSSTDVFSRCIGILSSEYFEEPAYKPLITFMKEYFEKYNNLPTFDIINAEFDVGFVPHEITLDQYQYTCDEVEKYCKQAAFIQAIYVADELIEKNDIDAAHKKMTDALLISLDKDMGVDIYDDPETYLRKLLDTEINYPTGIKLFDTHLNGGLARKTLTLLSANSGVGKSNMLANLGANFSLLGLNVLYLSLELPEDMIYIRLSSIISQVNINLWKQRIPEIAGKILNKRSNGAGSYKVKRMVNGTTTNDIRSYIKHYELEYKIIPDVIIVDYLDLMHPNGGTKNKGVFEQDKEKSEELNELLFTYDAIGISASQQNREALRMAAPDQAVIAGGISKVNTVHNYISLHMSDEDNLRGEMYATFLKTRTSSGKGKTVMLNFDPNTLTITDPKNSSEQAVTSFVKNKQSNKKITPSSKKVANIIDTLQAKEPIKTMVDIETGEILSVPESETGNPLLKMMEDFGA